MSVNNREIMLCETIEEQARLIADLKFQIKDLEQQLAETDKLMQEYLSKCLSLEQQLAEKDQAIESLQEINQSLGQTCNNDAKEIERLREQLAEKDEGIKDLLQEIEDMENSQNVTAIAELEKVKELALKYFNLDECNLALATVLEQIDQQINNLRSK